MPQTTTLQGISLPVNSDAPTIPAHIKTAIEAVESRSNMRFTDTGARDSVITAPTGGMIAWLSTPKIFTYYDGTAWQNFGAVIQNLTLSSIDAVNAGGRSTYKGAGSNKDWVTEVDAATWRWRYDPSSTNKTVATLTSTQLQLGTGVSLYQDGVQQPTFRVVATAPGAGSGKDGDVWFVTG